MKRLACALAAVAATAASIVVPGTAAMASTTPQCVTITFINNIEFPASSGGSTNCWLAEGDYSSAVFAMQQAFTHCQADPDLADDWDYGTLTKKAVSDFQAGIDRITGENLLAVDGVYGPATRSYMSFYIPLTGGCS